MSKLVLLFFTVFCVSKFVKKLDVRQDRSFLKGTELTIEENDQKLSLPDLDYLLPEGGSKTAFDLQNGNVLLLPNDLPPSMWERFVNEEVAMDKFYSEYIKTSGVKKATFIHDTTTNYALYSKNFEEYQKEGSFILDSKGLSIPYIFQSKSSHQIPEMNEKVWVEILMPVVKQYSLMLREGVTPPCDDMLSFLYATRDSPHNVGSKNGPSVSMFGFDFTSKYNVTTPESFHGAPKHFTEEQQHSIQLTLKLLLEDIFCIKNYDREKFWFVRTSGWTKEEKVMAINVSKICVNEIRKSLEADAEYMKNIQDMKM